jgi:hypothetical protein
MKLWSVSTTVRNPERIREFLEMLTQLENQRWEVATQKRFQILLLQHRLYGYGKPLFKNTLTEEYKSWLNSNTFTEQQAETILESKNYKGGIEMRGRQSFNPIRKMGLAVLDEDKRIRITDFGRYFLREDYDLGNVFFHSFLKWQYPNPDQKADYPARDYNIKPFIATLHLINHVNQLCEQNGSKVKGVSRIELVVFFSAFDTQSVTMLS